jgi:hypothetical protein
MGQGIRREHECGLDGEMNTITGPGMQSRLDELDHEIKKLRAAIARSFQDEGMLFRTRGAVSELDVLALAEERHRNEAALFNLEKEQRELN